MQWVSERLRWVPIVAASLYWSGCATTYTVHSTPSGANVFYVDPSSQKKIFIGSTPLSYSKAALPAAEAFLMSVEKDGFKSAEVPMAVSDETKTLLTVNLKPSDGMGKQAATEINEVLRQLFRAQQLIYQKKFHAAILELDEVLRKRPEVYQAHVMKGTSYYLLNEMPSAVEAWRSAVKLNPDDPELSRFLTEKKINLK